MKQLLFKLLVLLLFVTGIIVGFDSFYRHQYKLDYKIPKNVLPKPAIDQKYQLVKVGNSHTQDAISFKSYNTKALDLSGVAQRFNFGLAQLKHHKNQIAPNAVIIIDVTHISFSHRKADKADGLQSIYYDAVSPIYIPDLDVSAYLQTTIFPFIRSGYLFRKTYGDQVQQHVSEIEKWKPDNSKIVISEDMQVSPIFTSENKKLSPKKNVTRPLTQVELIELELANPSKSPDPDFIDNLDFIFHKWLETDEFNPKYFETNRQDLERVIKFCLDHGWRPILITTPVSEKLEQALPKDYKINHLYQNIDLINKRGVEYFDFSNQKSLTSNMSLFRDNDHLNEKGSNIFSYVLLKKLISSGYLSQEVDGFIYPKATD